MILFGLNPVREALRAGRVSRIRAHAGGGARLRDVLQQARALGVRVDLVGASELDRLVPRGAPHQGVVAEVQVAAARRLDELMDSAGSPALFLVLDGIEDPRNLGALLRTAEAAGVDGVVRQARRAAALTGAAAKASAGAMAHVPIATVVNIARSLDELKARGVWVVGLAHEGEREYHQLDLAGPVALVVGAEGHGLRRLVREKCDWLVRVPMRGRVESLNVSVAAGVVLFEVLRQRRPPDAG